MAKYSNILQHSAHVLVTLAWRDLPVVNVGSLQEKEEGRN